MKFRSYVEYKEQYPKAVINFNNYARSGGYLRYLIIRLGLLISFIPLIRRIPVISWLSDSAEGLLLGHISELINFYDKSEFINRNELNSYLKLDALKIWDLVVIGSGPGAGAALHKTKFANEILIIESGQSSTIPINKHHTFTHLEQDFYKSGQEVILSHPIAQFAQGKVLGGGSEVNSGLYHRLPEIKSLEFTNLLGISNNKYKKSEEMIHKLLKPEIKIEDEMKSLIGRGAQALGMHFENIPRWRHYETSVNFQHFGMTELVWKEKVKNGEIKILTKTTALNIDNSNKDYIELLVIDSEGKKQKVRSRKLFVAAGSINTPYLLAKSGLIKWSDIHFQWHPMIRTIVETNESDLGFGDIDPFQAWVEDLSIKFGSAVSTPGLLATNLKQIVSPKKLKFMRSYYSSFVSTGQGGLIPHTRTPWYKYSKLDKHMLNKSSEFLKLFISNGGAKFSNNIKPIKTNPSTVHIFGTLPSNSNIYIQGTNKLKTDERIQICDGSILPKGPGVNPQAIIMSAVNALSD